LNQQHFLGQAVGCVGLFRIAIPQVLLFKREWSELRVSADGTQGDKSSTPRPSSCINCTPIIADVEEVSRAFIRTDAARQGC
jgi:hypothetical protein